jgi:hypothetical protein
MGYKMKHSLPWNCTSEEQAAFMLKTHGKKEAIFRVFRLSMKDEWWADVLRILKGKK